MSPQRPPVLIPFVCPVCAGANAVELVTLSRAGGTACVACSRFLRSADVMRAMHSPRADAGREQRAARAVPKQPAMVWPPTPESRAAIAPLKRRRDGDTN
ncbi:MAG TPA: hypothetical protein VFH78_01305 [Candidatus Thermoplasmatota archaeon]|nr:hypothetical protein [Candidatus Thermoplasmatota archaeon]